MREVTEVHTTGGSLFQGKNSNEIVLLKSIHQNSPYYRDRIPAREVTEVHTTGTRDNLPQYFSVAPQNTTAEKGPYHKIEFQ